MNFLTINSKLIIVCSFLILGFPSLCLDAGWHERRCEGWAYFEDRQDPENKRSEKREEPNKSPAELLQEYRREMEDSLALVVLDPTEENIQSYIELQNKWLKRAGDVSKTWTKVVLNNPSLDNSISGMPTSSYGTKYYHRKKSLRQKEIVKALSESYSLLCFYEGKNEASKEFSKVISIFSKRHDWVVQPISVDETLLQEFPNSVVDRGLKDELVIRHFPALYVLDPINKEATPIGFGLVSVDMIEANIALQFGELFEDDINIH